MTTHSQARLIAPSRMQTVTPEQQQRTAQELLGGGPIAAWLTTTLADWNIVLETITLVIGIIVGAFSAYFLIRRFIRERRKDK